MPSLSVHECACSSSCSRFAKILYINQELKQLHVHWYEHASMTYLKEISDPQELFLCPLCGDIDLLRVRALGKVKVHSTRPDLTRPSTALKANEYFCEYVSDFLQLD